MIDIIITLLITATPTAHAQSAYKCTGADGQAVYSQSPCSAAAETIRLPQRKEPPSWWRMPAEMIEPGMSADDVSALWGQPTTVNRTMTARGSREQWVYRLGRLSRFVYIENGIVTAVQD
jgi:hypothetical protein